MDIKMILPKKPHKTYNAISRSKGIGFAENFGFDVISCEELGGEVGDCVYIFDILIRKSELKYIDKHFRGLKGKSFFLFVIVDSHPHSFRSNVPTYECFPNWCRWYSNVGLLSLCPPTPTLRKILEENGINRYMVVHFPYPEEDECEVDLDSFSRRKEKIIFSGATGNRLYLYRKQFLKNVGRERFDVLAHPGYYKPTMHSIVGKRYIEFLSQYKIMFVSPSTAHYELLKYSECAAAGCVPIGICPETLNDDILITLPKRDVRGWDSIVAESMSLPDEVLYEMAMRYRNFYIENRSKEVARKNILARCSEWLEQNGREQVKGDGRTG